MATYTMEQYERLKAAIAEGVQTVQYTDKRVEYRSLAEMRSILAEMERDLGLRETTNRRFGVFSKGLRWT